MEPGSTDCGRPYQGLATDAVLACVTFPLNPQRANLANMDCFDCWFGLREFWKLFATQRVINRLTGTAAFDLNVIAGESFAGDFSRRNMGLTTDGISAAAFSPGMYPGCG
jgi:hypothetical protein